MSGPVLHTLLSRLSVRLASGLTLPIRTASHALLHSAAALRQMSQARHVGKVVVTSGGCSGGSCSGGGCSGGFQGAVLVTGGLGALGTLVASWLSGQAGVAHIILAGRSGRMPMATAEAAGLPLLDACGTLHSACVTLLKCVGA